ncbi:MAG: hypothetical protein U9Q78_08400 [Chloroflexota bacterium]|nr:hypothetical protein [Chloroflexota bacterium]
MNVLGTGELLIILFLLGMLLLLILLVVGAAALFLIWGPNWLEQQHRRWHAEHPEIIKEEE